jgi:hypothetical protein
MNPEMGTRYRHSLARRALFLTEADRVPVLFKDLLEEFLAKLAP